MKDEVTVAYSCLFYWVYKSIHGMWGHPCYPS